MHVCMLGHHPNARGTPEKKEEPDRFPIGVHLQALTLYHHRVVGTYYSFGEQRSEVVLLVRLVVVVVVVLSV